MAILTMFRHRFYKNDGTVNAGGKVYTYVAGTTTPISTYTDSGAGTPNANPIVLDSKGEADIWTTGQIKVNVLEADNTQVTGWPVDNVGSGVANNDANTRWAGTAAGTANALIISPSPSITSYVAGQSFVFKSGASANSGATTIEISGLSAIAIQSNGAACAGGEILANNWYQIVLSTDAICQIAKIGEPTKAELGLVIGTDVQAYDADLTTWAGVTPGTGVATFLATPTLANFNTALSDADVATGGGTATGTNTGDQTATTVANTPAGSIAATTVQAAINELDTEKAALAGSATQVFSVAAATSAAHATAYSQLADGWVSVFNTWAYASASTFTISGDYTATFTKGTKIGWTQTTDKFGHVASSSFGGGNTTVTILVNADYTIANAAITLPKLSRADRPVGFPSQFNFASTIVGLTIGAVGIYYRLDGGFVHLKFAISGTSNAANFTASMPIACTTADASGFAYGIGAGAYNASAWQTTPAAIGISNGSTTLNFGLNQTTFSANAFAGFTATGGKAVQGDFCYPY